MYTRASDEEVPIAEQQAHLTVHPHPPLTCTPTLSVSVVKGFFKCWGLCCVLGRLIVQTVASALHTHLYIGRALQWQRSALTQDEEVYKWYGS